MKELLEIINDYICLEKEINSNVREISGNICSSCDKVCCDEKFCEVVSQSEFLSLVVQIEFESRGIFINPAAYKSFLGNHGCILQAGRYPECIRFICLRIVQRAFKDPYEKIYYYALNNLISGISGNFLGRYNLYELELEKINSPKNLERLRKRVNDARDIFNELLEFKKIIDKSPDNVSDEDIRDYIFKFWGLFPFAAKSMYLMREPTISMESFYE